MALMAWHGGTIFCGRDRKKVKYYSLRKNFRVIQFYVVQGLYWETRKDLRKPSSLILEPLECSGAPKAPRTSFPGKSKKTLH